MEKNIKQAAIAFVIILMSASFTAAQQQKLAQTGMKFLSLSLDARGSGLSNSITSLEDGAASMFYNPAGMARLDNLTNISLGRVNYIADINYNYASATFVPFKGDYGVFGLSFESVDYGLFQGTVRADNTQGFVDVGTFSPTAMAFGLGYAKALSEKFSVGGIVKYVAQSLGTSTVNVDANGNYLQEQSKTNVLAFDFGILYKTGFKSLSFGMDVKNFSREVRYITESFQLPLVFNIGISMNAFDLIPQIDGNMHSFLISVDASHPRDYPEQLSIGGEYTFMKLISLRVGFTSPTDIQGVSAGLGIKHSFSGYDFAFDYSYTSSSTQDFSNVQRFTFSFAF